MRLRSFLSCEAGAITVDWAMLAAAATGLALSGAAVIGGASGRFSDIQERELALINGAGVSLAAYDDYRPSDPAIYDALLAGLQNLPEDQLHALAAYTNRLHAQGVTPTRIAPGGGASGGGTPDTSFLDILAGGDGTGTSGQPLLAGAGDVPVTRPGGYSPSDGPIHDRAGGDGAVAQGETVLHDLIAAVDHTYRALGVGRPTHTRIDGAAVDAAISGLGLNSSITGQLYGS